MEEVHRGSCLCVCTACTAASQQEGPGFDSRMGRCWSWGVGSPQASSAQVGYLPGFSVWSLHVLPVFTRGFLHQEPQQKNMQKEQNTCPSLTKDGQFTWTWSPGAYKLPTAPGGSWRKDNPGWEKAEDKFTATSGLRVCVCVCPVSPPYIHVCANKRTD